MASFTPQPHPWIRFWARTFDLLLFSFTFAILIIILFRIFPALRPVIKNDKILALICFFCAFITEAILIAWIGATPGKYLLNISVRAANHSLLSFPVSLKRSLTIWIKGYAFGIIPPISLLTVGFAGNTIQKHGRASWDVGDNILVLHRPIDLGKNVIFTILFLIMVIVLIYLWLLDLRDDTAVIYLLLDVVS